MVPDTPRRGWRISEVEALLGLARRDIQRCCYTGRGGVGILEPEDSAWGRRTYNVRDLAQLFLVRQYRRQGLSLPEVKQVLDDHCATGRTVRDLLAIQVDRLTDQADEVLGQLLQAQTLLAAVSEQPGAVEEVVERQVQARTALQPGASRGIPAHGRPSWMASLLGSQDLLDSPGMALAVDLWLGPGATRALREACASVNQATEERGENDEAVQ